MQQNTPEWREFRRNKIGASDAAPILGISPYQTAFDLWEEKVFGRERETTQAMARGTAMEDKARHVFERMTGIAMLPKVVLSKKHEWQMASLDGISLDEGTFVEIKCPSHEVHKMAENGEIPPYYYSQLQHQLCVLEVKMGFYFSFDGEKGAVVEVTRDEKYIDDLLAKEEQFYQCLINRDPPALGERDYAVQETSDWIKLSEEWKVVASDLKSLEKKESELRKHLVDLTNGKNSKGNGILVTRSNPKGSVDYGKIPELIGVDLEMYRKPSSERWTIRSTKN